ncbi:C3H1-type domain-containing protein [Plasmodiophora brassicae]
MSASELATSSALTRACSGYSSTALRHVRQMLEADDADSLAGGVRDVLVKQRAGARRRVLSQAMRAQIELLRAMPNTLQQIAIDVLNNPNLLDNAAYVRERRQRSVLPAATSNSRGDDSALPQLIAKWLRQLPPLPPMPAHRIRTWFIRPGDMQDEPAVGRACDANQVTDTTDGSVELPAEVDQSVCGSSEDEESGEYELHPEAPAPSNEVNEEVNISSSGDDDEEEEVDQYEIELSPRKESVEATPGGSKHVPSLSEIALTLKSGTPELPSATATSTKKRNDVSAKAPTKRLVKRVKFARPAQKYCTPCEFWATMRCAKGDQCPFSHDGAQTRSSVICRYFMMGSCVKGEDCSHSHDVPCKHFHLGKRCKDVGCRFKHDPMTTEELELFRQRVSQGYYLKPAAAAGEPSAPVLPDNPFEA